MAEAGQGTGDHRIERLRTQQVLEGRQVDAGCLEAEGRSTAISRNGLGRLPGRARESSAPPS